MSMVGCPVIRMTGIGGTGGRAVMHSKRPFRSSSFPGLLLLAAHLTASTAQAADPNLFIMGVWPDRLRLFDQTTESFVGELRLRHAHRGRSRGLSVPGGA